jgi:hypothetical protein
MKNAIKIFGIIALAVIGFSMTACGGGGGGNPLPTYWVNNIEHIAYGNGKWVAMTDFYHGRQMASSVDGISWTAVTYPFPLPAAEGEGVRVTQLIGGNGGFVAVVATSGTISPDHYYYSSRIWYSANGETWTEVGISGDYSAYCNGDFLVFGGSKIMRSADGEIWTEEEDWNYTDWDGYEYPMDGFSNIVYGNGKYVILLVGRLYYSTDIRNWTTMGSELDYLNLSDYIVYGNGKWLAGSRNSDGLVGSYYSTDGENWTLIESGPNYGFIPCVGNNTFISMNNDWNLMYSTDGITWTKSSVIKDFSSIAWGDNKFIIYGTDGSVDANKNALYGLFRSANGITWTKIPDPEAFKIDY